MTENVDTSQLRRKGGLASTATALLGIDRNVLRPRFFEKDEYQGVAGLGHRIASLRWPVISPATPLAYSATTSPKLLRWMATFCPAATLSLSLTRCSPHVHSLG